MVDADAYLAKTHLVCQDTIDTLFVQCCEPVETLQLILLELCNEHLRLRDRQRAHQGRWILEVKFIGVDCDRVRFGNEGMIKRTIDKRWLVGCSFSFFFLPCLTGS